MALTMRPAGPGGRVGMASGGPRVGVLQGGGKDSRPSKAPLTWRGHGGAAATPSSVVFDKQLDKISLWMEHWDHETRCLILDRLLRESDITQLRLLWTVLQPALHRDFMYTASKQFPSEVFTPISTYTGREVLGRVSKSQRLDYHRIQSAHIQLAASRAEVQDMALPAIDGATPTSSVGRLTTPGGAGRRDGRCNTQQSHISPSRMSKASKASSMFSKSSTLSKSTRLSVPRTIRSRESSDDNLRSQSLIDFSHGVPPQSATPCVRFIEMPVRRHMQEESSPRRGLWSHDVIDDVRPVSDADMTTVPSFANRWHIHVPVCMPFNTPAPTDTARAKVRVKVKLKVKVKKDQAKPLTVDLSEGKDTNMYEFGTLMTNSHDEQKEVIRIAASVDIPAEGWQLLHWYTTTWNSLQKNEFLHKLLIKLDQRQHYYISSILSVKHHVDIVGLLPERLALRIVSYFRPTDLAVAARVSKKWLKLCNNNSIWKRKCKAIRLEIPVLNSNPDWKAVFKDNKSITSNWNTGNCEVVECKGHHDRVLSVIFDDKKMATGSADKTIKIWDVKDGRCIQTLRGHEKGVWALRFFTDQLIISASFDSTIRVWNLREGTCLRTLIGHSAAVWAIERVGNTLVSASHDCTAKVWDISRCLLMRSLRGHGGPVFCVDLNEDGKIAVTGSSDRTIRLWSTESGRQLKLIWVSTNSVMAVSYSWGWIACSHGTVVSLYGPEGNLRATFDEHMKRIECIELKIKDPDQPSGLIISAGKDGVMKQWDIAKKECIKNFVVSKSQVNCIHFDEMRIASAAYDNKIKLWDFTIKQTSRAADRR